MSPQMFLQTTCLRFYYFMMGVRVGSLNVQADIGGERTTLWNVTGDKGDQWLLAEVTLNEEKPFKIVIQSTVGYNYVSDIAIDDITVTDGSCKKVVSNSCSVICVHSDKKMMKYNHTIKDGVQCSADKEDMCVDGKCEAVGCDGQIGSKKIYDKCKVCGGDGSTCALGNAIISVKPRSLEDVILYIPPGSTNIKIRKDLSFDGSIAAQMADTYYYADPPPFYPWYYFKMASSTFRYQILENKSQTIYADGPTSHQVKIKLVFQDYGFTKSPPIDIHLSYYVKKDTTQDMFVFKFKKITNCSHECGSGNYSIIYGCFNIRYNKFVDDEKCSPSFVRPKVIVKPCNMHPCTTSYEYRTSPWGTCTDCNKMGLRFRNVTCTELKQGQDPRTVNDSYCSASEKPKNEKNCYLYCPYANKKCSEKSRRCPEMLQKGYCRYRSVQLLCCTTCASFYMISPGSYIIV